MSPFLGEKHLHSLPSWERDQQDRRHSRASSGEPWVASSDKAVACALDEPAAGTYSALALDTAMASLWPWQLSRR